MRCAVFFGIGEHVLQAATGFVSIGGPMRTRVFAVFVVAIVAFCGSYATAQDNTPDPGEGIRVVQQKPFVKAMRFEIEPTFNLPMNETVI